MSEKVKIKIARNVVHLPAIALRGLVVFPNNVVHFEVGRTKSIAAIEAAMHANSSVFLIAQRGYKIRRQARRCSSGGRSSACMALRASSTALKSERIEKGCPPTSTVTGSLHPFTPAGRVPDLPRCPHMLRCAA